MEIDEVIHRLESFSRQMCRDCMPDIGRGGSDSCDFCDDAECYDTAIAELRKRQEQEPNVDGGWVNCPSCGRALLIGENICQDCGKKIKWR